MSTSAPSSASLPTAPPPTAAPPTKYDVHGIILDLGEALPAAACKEILARLREAVPEFAALTTPTSPAAPLGNGASDVLVEFPEGRRITIAQTWDAVHALLRHPLVADCEPAVGYTIAPAPSRAAARSSDGGDIHLPGSLPREWSIEAVRAQLAQTQFNVTGAGVRVGHPTPATPRIRRSRARGCGSRTATISSTMVLIRATR